MPRKNIRLVAGKPLIAYSIEAALAVRHLLYRLIVSTDDDEIASVARHYGAEVPFMRPVELSGDNIPTVPVLQHAVRLVEEQDQICFEWVLLLQPTSPLRTPQDIEVALSLAESGETDSVISVVQVKAGHPAQMKRIENDRLLPYCLEEKEGTRRQDLLPCAYLRNGAIYLTKRDVLIETNSIWGNSIRPYVMPEERSVNIDGELDLKLAEIMIQEKTSSTRQE